MHIREKKNIDLNDNSFLKDLLKESTFFGLIYIFRQKRRFIQILWLFVILIQCGLCIYFLLESIFDYFTYDYTTLIKSIAESPSQFPAIALCYHKSKKFSFTILNLSFDRKDYKPKENSRFFSQYQDSTYGNCYRFLDNKSLAFSSQSGPEYGFEVSLYVHNQIDIGKFAISIYNQSAQTNNIFNKAYFILTGSYNYFSIKRIFEKQLPQPFNDCYEDLSLFELNKTIINSLAKQKNLSYTQKNCVGLCRNLKLIEYKKCNCINSLENDLTPQCQNNECKNDFINKFLKNDPYKKCSSYCPLECNSFKLDINFNSINLPSYGNITDKFGIQDFNDYKNLSRSFLHFNIYYDDLKYTYITQIPKMKTFDLFSNVGGLFGLFLGMSLLSFFEAFELLLEIFIKKLLKLRN